jgi:hypothetical protein
LFFGCVVVVVVVVVFVLCGVMLVSSARALPVDTINAVAMPPTQIAFVDFMDLSSEARTSIGRATTSARASLTMRR